MNECSKNNRNQCILSTGTLHALASCKHSQPTTSSAGNIFHQPCRRYFLICFAPTNFSSFTMSKYLSRANICLTCFLDVTSSVGVLFLHTCLCVCECTQKIYTQDSGVKCEQEEKNMMSAKIRMHPIRRQQGEEQHLLQETLKGGLTALSVAE